MSHESVHAASHTAGHDHGHGHDDHDHEHGHDGHDHEHPTGIRGVLHGLFTPHSHDAADSIDDALEGSAQGIRAVKVSLIGLGSTAIAQLAIVVVSGSVALLADTVHNFSDALTAIPLWIAFALTKRAPSKRYTYGYGRAEDLAGLFIVAMIALGFVGLGARAAYVQVFGNAFFQRQGEVRFARTLELPANRGKILDRNGLILASSVPAASIWAIPEDVEQDKPEVRAKLKELARLMDMPLAALNAKLADEDKTFVWIKRQLDWEVGQKIAALDIKGIYQRKEYKRQYPEGEAAAHVVGFTNVEDHGQEGMELAFDKDLAGKPGSRRVIKDRLGRVVEGVGTDVPPVDGKDMQLSIDSKVQFFAYQKLRDQVTAHKAKAGSVVVLDAHTGEL